MLSFVLLAQDTTVCERVARALDYDVAEAARDLAGDRWLVYGTWKWIDLQAKVAPTYRYYFTRPRPASMDGKPAGTGATHSAEIEYALGNLNGNKVYAWSAEDRALSTLMQGYFANFIKTGNPNGAGLPEWPQASSGADRSIRAEAVPADEYLPVLRHAQHACDLAAGGMARLRRPAAAPGPRCHCGSAQ